MSEERKETHQRLVNLGDEVRRLNAEVHKLKSQIVDPRPVNEDKLLPVSRWKTYLHELGKWLTVGGVLAGIVVAGLTYLQWKDLKKNFETDERSWIKIGISYPPLKTDQDATISATLYNTGKSVVTYYRADAAFEVLDGDKQPSFSLHQRHSDTEGAPAFPSDSTPFSIKLFDAKSGAERTFTPDEVLKLSTGKAYVATFGMILYTDRFGLHWYRFCNWHGYGSGSANASACVGWNTVGDGKPNVPF